jgi:hypothetical protein
LLDAKNPDTSTKDASGYSTYLISDRLIADTAGLVDSVICGGYVFQSQSKVALACLRQPWVVLKSRGVAPE